MRIKNVVETIIVILSLALAGNALAKTYEPVVVDETGKLPSGSNFKSANDIASKSEVLHKNQNLNDVANKATARTNLDVFSKAETTAEIKNTAFTVGSYLIVVDTTPTVNRIDPTEVRTINMSGITYNKTTLTGATTQATTTAQNEIKTTYTAKYDRVRLNNGNGTADLVSLSYYIPKFTAWTDCEFKVMDGSSLIYWVSTQRGAQMNTSYEGNGAVDLNAKIYYTCAEYYESRRWIEFQYDPVHSRSIYEHARRYTGYSTPTIGGIVIQPNMTGKTKGGRDISSIFGTTVNNATKYSYVYLKCSPTNFDAKSGAQGNERHAPIWRPIVPQPIQKAY